MVLYSDAESTGRIGAVAQLPCGRVEFLAGRLPRAWRRALLHRRTNIVGFELLAALAAVFSLCPAALRYASVVHYIDCTPALACVVRGFSKKEDLALIAGRLWFELSALDVKYEARYVHTKDNLADGPSRGDFSLMLELDAVHKLSWAMPPLGSGLDSWMSQCHCVSRVVA